MDTGVILNCQLDDSSKIGSVNTIPEFNPQGKSCWCYRKPKDKNKVMGANLSILFLILMNHLQNCTLKKQNLLEYFSGYDIFEEKAQSVSCIVVGIRLAFIKISSGIRVSFPSGLIRFRQQRTLDFICESSTI